jgi:general secretion pathway protein N
MRIIRPLSLSLLVLLALAVILLATAPASLVHRWYGADLAPLELQQVSGSLWRGSAASASLLGEPLGRLDWTLDPWDTLRGHASGELRISGERTRGQAQFARDGARLEIARAKLEFPARLLGPALDIPALTLLGRIEVDLTELVLNDGLPERAVGQASWRELGISGAAVAQLPGIAARLETPQPGSVRIVFEDLGGALAVRGSTAIDGDRFLTEAELSLREVNPQLAEVLKFVGQRRADGSSYLRVEGRIEAERQP